MILLTLSLLSVARAGPVLDAHALIQTHSDSGSAQGATGLGLGAGWALTPRWSVEALGQAVWQGAPAIWVGPELRVTLLRDEQVGALSLVGGAATQVAPARAWRGDAGLSLDLATPWALQPRAQLRGVMEQGGVAGLQLSLGAAWGRRPEPEPAPVVEAAPPPPAPVNTLEIDTPGAMVWVPHPWCAWLPADQASALLGQLQPWVDIQVVADGYLPTTVAVSGPTHLSLAPAPAQGALVVVGQPGDRVEVAGHAVEMGADGVAILNAPEGFLDVRVLGGGRVLTREVAVANGHALWLHAPPPGVTELRFEAGSSRLSGADLARIRAIASAAGDWSFEVQGSVSPEGSTDVNQRLAQERAQAVTDALVAAGLDPVHVRAAAAQTARAGEDPAAMRVALIRPIPLEVRR